MVGCPHLFRPMKYHTIDKNHLYNMKIKDTVIKILTYLKSLLNQLGSPNLYFYLSHLLLLKKHQNIFLIAHASSLFETEPFHTKL